MEASQSTGRFVEATRAGMGRKKIQISRIGDERNRQVSCSTFILSVDRNCNQCSCARACVFVCVYVCVIVSRCRDKEQTNKPSGQNFDITFNVRWSGPELCFVFCPWSFLSLGCWGNYLSREHWLV